MQQVAAEARQNICNCRRDRTWTAKTEGEAMQAKTPSEGFGTSIGTIAFASSIGTTIEWYDFFLFGVVTPIVLNKLFFPNFDPSGRHVAGLHDVLRRLYIAPDRRHHLRPLRRPYRPQDRAYPHASDHGCRNLPDRIVADLCIRRHMGTDSVARASRLSGHRHRRRMGRRGAYGGRTFADRQAGLLRKLAADRRSGRAAAERGNGVPAVVLAGERLLRLGLAHCVFDQRRAGRGRPLYSLEDHGDTRIHARPADKKSRAGAVL